MAKKLKKYLPKDKILKIIEQASGRDKTILRVLWETGIRNEELRSLIKADIDLNERQITVRQGKGGKDRKVPISKSLADRLELTIEDKDAEDYVFPTNYGGEEKKMSDKNLERIVKKYSKKADVYVIKGGEQKPVWPHVFRHSMAVHQLKQTGNLRALQKKLGHSSLTTTQIYLDITGEDVLTEHDRTDWD